MGIEHAVHHQDIIALALGRLDISVLRLLIGSIEINQVAVLILLVRLDQRLVLLEREVLAVHVLQQSEALRTLGELLVRQHTIDDEDLQVIPLSLIIRTLLFEYILQSVRHLLGDMAGNLLHVAIALQIASGDVQRNVRRIDDTMQQRQEVRHDALHRIGDEDLVAVELDLILLNLDIILDLREIEDTRQVEREVHVQVDIEQRVVRHRIELTIELLVILVLQVGGLACPSRRRVVDHVQLARLDLLAILPLLLLAECDRDREELAIFVQQFRNLMILKEFLVLVIDMQNNIRTTVRLLGILHRILRATVARPFHSLRTLLKRFCDDVHTFGDHERGVETESEVTDDRISVILVFLEELLRTGESDLVDILLDFLLRHTDTTVGDGERTLILIDIDVDRHIAQLALELTH